MHGCGGCNYLLQPYVLQSFHHTPITLHSELDEENVMDIRNFVGICFSFDRMFLFCLMRHEWVECKKINQNVNLDIVYMNVHVSVTNFEFH